MNIRKEQGLSAVRYGENRHAVASMFLLLLLFADSSRLVTSTSLLASMFWTVFRSALGGTMAARA